MFVGVGCVGRGEEYLRGDIRATGNGLSCGLTNLSREAVGCVLLAREERLRRSVPPPPQPYPTPPRPNQLAANRPGPTARAQRATATTLVCMPNVFLAYRQKTTRAKLSSNGWGCPGRGGDPDAYISLATLLPPQHLMAVSFHGTSRR